MENAQIGEGCVRNAGNSRSIHLDVGGKDLYRNGTNQERMD